MEYHTPIYNLKAVVQETGLKPDTLRAWERRYGLPQPARSKGGHRLYSQRDIDILKWLVARQQEGLSISKAVALWNKLEADGQDPLQEVGMPGEPVTLSPVDGEPVDQLRELWVDACLAFDEQRSEQVLAQAFSLYPPELVCSEVLQKGLVGIGDGWYRGDVSVQQEHFASELAVRRIEAMLVAVPPPLRQGRVLVACPPGEEHTFSLLIISYLLKRRGWDVLYLGANVPVDRFTQTVESTRPRLVVMSAQLLPTAASMVEIAELLFEQEIPLAYGGAIFNRIPGLQDRITGHFLGERLEEVVQRIEQIMLSPRLPERAVPCPQEHGTALDYYRERLPLIEAGIWKSLDALNMRHEQLDEINGHMASRIIAALALGDMDYLSSEIEWVSGMLTGYEFPGEMLTTYLKVYHDAVEANINGEGKPVLEWLAGIR